MFEIDRLNERFIKDFALKMKPNIAYTPYFYERLEQYELYKPGTLKQYEDFKEYITSTYRDMDEYYDERNKFIQSIIKDQENLQDKYGIKGNALKEYNIGKYDFGSKNIYNMENINVQMISIDLKSASFQALISTRKLLGIQIVILNMFPFLPIKNILIIKELEVVHLVKLVINRLKNLKSISLK